MRKFELVIAGGGLTAARAIKAYREAGGAGRVALVAKETVLPYHRPALSKRYRIEHWSNANCPLPDDLVAGGRSR